jgi:hypothetical protein
VVRTSTGDAMVVFPSVIEPSPDALIRSARGVVSPAPMGSASLGQQRRTQLGNRLHCPSARAGIHRGAAETLSFRHLSVERDADSRGDARMVRQLAEAVAHDHGALTVDHR